jgi:hypothetical protein
VAGREHRRLGRNNQDGHVIRRSAERTVLVVTDGCSSGRRSEVGALLGAAFIADRLAACPNHAPHDRARDLEAGLDGYLVMLQGRSREPPLEFLAEYLLFTFLAAVIEPEAITVLGLGDGFYRVGEEPVQLSAGEDNAPPYAAYRLIAPQPPPITVHAVVPSEEAGTVVIGTDGAAALGDELDELLAEDRIFANPHLLQRRLNLISARPGQLWDDTTLIAARRELR